MVYMWYVVHVLFLQTLTKYVPIHTCIYWHVLQYVSLAVTGIEVCIVICIHSVIAYFLIE